MSTPAQPAGPRAANPRPGPQQHIAALRAGVLGGRGPGASSTELAARQRQRVDFGGLPVTVAREKVALTAEGARGAEVDEAQARSARLLARLASRPATGQRPRGTGAASTLALGALLGFAAASRLHRRGQR